MKKFLTLAVAALVGLVAVSGPAEAHGRHDGWRDGHRHSGWQQDRRDHRRWKNERRWRDDRRWRDNRRARYHARHNPRCWTEWRHHRRVRVCR